MQIILRISRHHNSKFCTTVIIIIGKKISEFNLKNREKHIAHTCVNCYDGLYNRWWADTLSSPAAFVNINSPYISWPGFITHESNRRGRFTMAQQIAARLYRWRRYSGGGVCQCERTSVKSGASIMQRGGSTSEIHPDAVVTQAPLPWRKSIRHAAKRYICSRRDERRNASGKSTH